MVNMAICDNDELAISKVIDITSTFKTYNNINIKTFLSGEELLSYYSGITNVFDIIILDIEMDGINGIETAQKIRKYDKNVKIVFLTNYADFAIKGYEVSAFRYILKNQPNQLFRDQVYSMLDEYYHCFKSFIISYKNSKKELFVKDILYFEINQRIIDIHCVNQNYEIFDTITNIEKDHALVTFVKPHRSYLINPFYIDFIDKNVIQLVNHQRIPLSRNYKNIVSEQYARYLCRK